MNNFEEWKWRSLRKRRVFFFFFVNVILTLAWAVVHYDEPHGYTNADNGKNYPTHAMADGMHFQLVLLYGLPSFFFYLHAIGCFFISFTQWGQRVIQETQGRKFCIWSAVSLSLAAFYLEIPLIYGVPNLSSAQRMVSTLIFIFTLIKFSYPCNFHLRLGYIQYCSYISATTTTLQSIVILFFIKQIVKISHSNVDIGIPTHSFSNLFLLNKFSLIRFHLSKTPSYSSHFLHFLYFFQFFRQCFLVYLGLLLHHCITSVYHRGSVGVHTV